MSKEVKRYVARDIREHTSTDAWAAPSAIQLVDARDYEALLAERDRLLEDRDSQQRVCITEMDKVNQLRAEAEALKKDAEHRAPLNEAIQRAAGELPNGWEIRLCVERDAGWVELYDPDGNDIEDFATDAERLDYTVIDALEHALQGEQP